MNKAGWNRSPVLQWIFYGNFFYGICAVAQSVEAGLQQESSLNGWTYYSLVFLATVLYYNYPYARKFTAASKNPRTTWYRHHYTFLWWHQVIVTVVLTIATAVIFYKYKDLLPSLNAKHWLLAFLFPTVAGLYYGLNFLSIRYNLRSIGWLKPFVIGFTWAGLVVVYPVLWQKIQAGKSYDFTLFSLLLFIKNMMFIALLCIMFDIKDYATDHSSNLKTFVVSLGLRKTIFFILLPLTLLGLLTFITYGVTHHFSGMKIAINMIPFALLIMASVALRKRRPIMYYHVVIDGLMLVKAACGITAMLLF